MDLSALHIFKAGTRTSHAGEVLTFTPDDLRASAAAYDVTLHEAPLVIGHPKDNAPAYGWVKKLRVVNGGDLEADGHQVEASFAEDVKSGARKKVSASFYRPDHPNNPVPGVWYLRHVGFLGAMPPAVKGLRPVSFAEGDDEGLILTVEFAEDPQEDEMPDDTPGAGATNATGTGDSHARSGADLDALARREAELTARLQALEAREVNFAEREAGARRAEDAAFVEQAIADGAVRPCDKDGMVAFMESLEADAVCFGEGDAAQTPRQWFRKWVAGLPKVVEFGEIAGAEDTSRPVDFACPPGFTVSPGALSDHARIQAYMAAHPGATLSQAVVACGIK